MRGARGECVAVWGFQSGWAGSGNKDNRGGGRVIGRWWRGKERFGGLDMNFLGRQRRRKSENWCLGARKVLGCVCPSLSGGGRSLHYSTFRSSTIFIRARSSGLGILTQLETKEGHPSHCEHSKSCPNCGDRVGDWLLSARPGLSWVSSRGYREAMRMRDGCLNRLQLKLVPLWPIQHQCVSSDSECRCSMLLSQKQQSADPPAAQLSTPPRPSHYLRSR